MAEPARRQEAADEAPPYDPRAIQRTLIEQRARREALRALMETPDPLGGEPEPEYVQPPPEAHPRPPVGIWTAGARISWVAGLVLMLSSFMDWYAGTGEGLTIGVIGWHT